MEKVAVSGHCDSRLSEIEEIFRKSLESGFDTGAAIAIEKDGEMLVDLWGGHKDRDRSEPWSENTILNVFSTTKAVTALCIVKLIDEGKLNLTEKVTTYWPDYGCNGKEHTKVSDFLCHRAGMFGFEKGFPDIKFGDWESWIDLLQNQAPFYTPGSTQGYHALTYGWLVGEIIRRIDGRSVGEYFREEIADPFGIDFKIGLNDADITRCGDVLVDSKPNPKSFEILKFVPSFLLPAQLKNLKQFLSKGDFKIAFDGGITDSNYVNEDEWRKAEIPSANGHGTAKSLAKLFGILSTGCEREGKKLLNENTLIQSIKPLSNGPDTVLFGADINFGVGFDIGLGITTIASKKHPASIFGHCGIGGSVAFGDLEKKIGYGFLCNRMHKLQELYQTTNKLTRALYKLI